MMTYLTRLSYRPYVLLLAVLLLTSNAAHSETIAGFYTQGSSGWKWYIDALEKSQQRSAQPMSNPSQTLQALRQRVQQSLDKAVLEPTLDNVTTYLGLQNKITYMASRFTATWQQVLLQSPQLDFSLTNPTNSVARQVYVSEGQQHNDIALKRFARDYGLFFFYRSDCPYCHRFSPLIKNFADKYGIDIIAISLDGEALAPFFDFKHDQGQAAALGVNAVPALFAVQSANNNIVPLAYGIVSDTELVQRISALVDDKDSIQ